MMMSVIGSLVDYILQGILFKELCQEAVSRNGTQIYNAISVFFLKRLIECQSFPYAHDILIWFVDRDGVAVYVIRWLCIHLIKNWQSSFCGKLDFLHHLSSHTNYSPEQ